MEKTRIFAFAAVLAALIVLAVAGAVYAQTAGSPLQTSTTGIYGQMPQARNFATGQFGFRCPWLSNNAFGANGQAAYGSTFRTGMGGGMMGRQGW